jgi:hypothetical protein
MKKFKKDTGASKGRGSGAEKLNLDIICSHGESRTFCSVLRRACQVSEASLRNEPWYFDGVNCETVRQVFHRS